MKSAAPVPLHSPGPARLMSLDVFRGATIAAMILVNNPGNWSAIYKPLDHAAWHGWTFTDLIFPFFLWIVGVAIPLSIARRIEQGQSRRQLLLHALRRAVITNIMNSEMDELVVTDTIPLSAEAQACGRIRQLSLAPLLAETVRRINNEESISAMFELF